MKEIKFYLYTTIKRHMTENFKKISIIQIRRGCCSEWKRPTCNSAWYSPARLICKWTHLIVGSMYNKWRHPAVIWATAGTGFTKGPLLDLNSCKKLNCDIYLLFYCLTNIYFWHLVLAILFSLLI